MFIFSLCNASQVYYETIKTRVEESFGACNSGEEHNVTEDNMQLFGTCNSTRMLISCLDSLTNKGLYYVATTLTGGSTKFEKTRRQMKKVIREFLSNSFRNRNHNCQEKSLKQLSHHLNNPKNFRENCLMFSTPTLQSHHATVFKVLDELENLPFQALIAMDRKLRGVQGCMPQLRRHRHGRCRGHIIDRVRKTSKKMLSELGKVDELPEPLVKAMAIAGLSLKLKRGCQSSSEMEFHQFLPEIKSLQNEIVKAIWLLKTKVRFPELKTLQCLLDQNADISNSCLRTAIKKMLIEYLFECSEMNTIPKSLLEALAIINRTSRSPPFRCYAKEEIEQEVECVLSMSAQTKQIVLDFLPEHEYDQDFTDAYIEELEESDDSGYDNDDSSDGNVDNDGWQSGLGTPRNIRFPFVESDYKLEGIGESMPVDSKSPASATWENGSSVHLTPNKRINGNSVGKIEPEDFTIADSMAVDFKSPASATWGNGSSVHFTSKERINGNSAGKSEPADFTIMDSVPVDFRSPASVTWGNGSSARLTPNKKNNENSVGDIEPEEPAVDCKPHEQRNQYLAIQEVCDETSMVAYDLIGHMLGKFAQEDEVDLDCNDSSYLRGNSSNQEYGQGI